MTADAPIVIEPTRRADACVIWLHGLGADGSDFEPVVAELSAAVRARTRFVFPHAPRRAVTINGGMVMRAWYDILEASLDRRVDADGVRESADHLARLADAERQAGIDPARIVFAGFSQGGAIALHAGLRYPHRLGGILALSTYLALDEDLDAEIAAASADVPLFLGHGSQDPIVPLLLSERTRQRLVALGRWPEVHTYPMPHSVSAEEIRDIDAWMERLLLRTG